MKLIRTKYPILEMTIELQGMPEPVYRKVALRTGTSLRELHHIIQSVMPWDSTHLFEFIQERDGNIIRYGDTMLWDGEMPMENDDQLHFVEDLLVSKGDSMEYVYDMGDYWEHEIVLDNIITDPFKYPVLPMVIGGAGVCPPEDCGGVPGYLELRKVLAGKKGKRYKETKAWLDSMGWQDKPFDRSNCIVDLNLMKMDMMTYYYREEYEDPE